MCVCNKTVVERKKPDKSGIYDKLIVSYIPSCAVVERRSLAGELSLSRARLAADG